MTSINMFRTTRLTSVSLRDRQQDPGGLIRHADHGSNYTAMVYTERMVEPGAVSSTGTVGDNFDNAMAEAVNKPPQDRADLTARLISRRRLARGEKVLKALQKSVGKPL